MKKSLTIMLSIIALMLIGCKSTKYEYSIKKMQMVSLGVTTYQYSFYRQPTIDEDMDMISEVYREFNVQASNLIKVSEEGDKWVDVTNESRDVYLMFCGKKSPVTMIVLAVYPLEEEPYLELSEIFKKVKEKEAI